MLFVQNYAIFLTNLKMSKDPQLILWTMLKEQQKVFFVQQIYFLDWASDDVINVGFLLVA